MCVIDEPSGCIDDRRDCGIGASPPDILTPIDDLRRFFSELFSNILQVRKIVTGYSPNMRSRRKADSSSWS